MGDNRFSHWQRAQGWEGAPLFVVAVKLLERELSVECVGEVPERGLEMLADLATDLSRQWQVTVRFVVSPRQIEEAVMRVLPPALTRIIGEHAVQLHSQQLTLTFPSPIAEALFVKWGGPGRLKREITELQNYSIETVTSEVEPPPPDQPVSLNLATISQDDVIGRLSQTAEPEPIRQLADAGHAVVAGQIFQRDVREGRDGSRHWTWTITDETSALRLTYSERKNTAKISDDMWPVGTQVLVEGELERDKFTQEQVLRVKAGRAIPVPAILTRDVRPRVELHVHTKMSAMDSLIAPRDLFRAAQEAGMSAVAVVDHGVVQSFPEWDSLAQSTGVHALYGVEVYMVESEAYPLSGGYANNWRDRPLVVVDVETTGLSPRSHQVIELGAVKLVGGQIQETFHRLVRPRRSISKDTERITGITEKTLLGGISEVELWQEFFAFLGDGVLAAHNARFDMGFVRAGFDLVYPGQEFDPPVLDTLALARVAVPGLKSYGLEPLTNHYRIALPQHHRALADAEATAHLAVRLLDDLGQRAPQWSGQDSLPLSHTMGRPVPVTLLVKDQEGLEALYRLISASHLQFFYRVPRVPRQAIVQGRQHWLIGSSFHDGEISEALFRNASPNERRTLEQFYDYWEIVPPEAAHSLMAEGALDGREAVQAFLTDIVAWGETAKRPVVAVSDAHYLRPVHAIYRDVLAATAKGDLHNAQDALYLRSGSEMEEELSFLSQDRRDRVIYKDPEMIAQQLQPLRPVPQGLFSPNLPQAEEVIAHEPYRRARELYGENLPDIVQRRLDKEVQSIVSHGFSSIYYTAHRLVQKSLDDGYLVGSRGSVGSSLVATLLNITEVNPLPPHYRCPACRWSEFVTDGSCGSGFDLPPKSCPVCQTLLLCDGQDIPFETFLGFEGDKVPDIDLNFSGEYQTEIHRYTEALFGQGHVFRAGTIATIADKTAFGLVKAWARDRGRELSGAEIDWLAASLTGVKRTTGQHPGGLMVVPHDDDIHRFSPVQHPADDRNSEVVTTHFDYHSIEGRLLKLDLLGHDDPTAIRMLEDLTGIKAKDVPFQDEATMSLFSGVSALGVRPDDIKSPVGSLGIPEFGTRFVRQMLLETRPRTFAELVRISGLSHGTEVWTNNAQELIRQKTATLSEVIATRDDIMTYLISRHIAPKTAFAISESVRKGRGLSSDMADTMRAAGVPEWYIDSCRHISYLFPKAHAAAYVMMGWRIAWFKVHYPLAYYATYFSVRAGDFEPEAALRGLTAVNQALSSIEEKGSEASPKEKGLVTVLEIMREMLARGYRFKSVDLERSHGTRFLIDQDALVIPFAALPGLGVNAARHIIAARSDQPFLSVDDLRQRARLSKSIVELLRSHGALKDLGETSQLGFF